MPIGADVVSISGIELAPDLAHIQPIPGFETCLHDRHDRAIRFHRRSRPSPSWPARPETAADVAACDPPRRRDRNGRIMVVAQLPMVTLSTAVAPAPQIAPEANNRRPAAKSGWGHLLQKRDVGATSASPLIATTSLTRRHVAKVPETDSGTAAPEELFDNLVSAGEQRRWHV